MALMLLVALAVVGTTLLSAPLSSLIIYFRFIPEEGSIIYLSCSIFTLWKPVENKVHASPRAPL